MLLAMTEEVVSEAPAYKDDDLVYVDPKNRVVVGMVEWNTAGAPKPLLMKDDAPEEPVEEEEKNPKAKKGMIKRPRRLRYYPWGTYRSMKNVYKIEGKQIRTESTNTLDQVIEKALKEPFWD